jgi:TrwC relaxase
MYPLRVGVTMSLHKLTAGSGYDYLTRQVAAFDATEKGHIGLASYYTERGETPGVWIGSGMEGIDGLTAGDPVTAEQMRALFGCGLHPLAVLRQQQLEGSDLTARDYQNAARLGRRSRSSMVTPAHSASKSPDASQRSIRQPACPPALPCPLPTGCGCGLRWLEFFRVEHGREPIDARELAGQIAKILGHEHRRWRVMT